jgi:hypothetical protein
MPDTCEGSALQILLQLPVCYPLLAVDVECVHRIGVTEARWKKWQRQISTMLLSQNGTISDALLRWKENVDQVFEVTHRAQPPPRDVARLLAFCKSMAPTSPPPPFARSPAHHLHHACCATTAVCSRRRAATAAHRLCMSVWSAQGVEECPICYMIVHASTGHLPKQECQTCHNKFHAACLYKWFSQAQKSVRTAPAARPARPTVMHAHAHARGHVDALTSCVPLRVCATRGHAASAACAELPALPDAVLMADALLPAHHHPRAGRCPRDVGRSAQRGLGAPILVLVRWWRAQWFG